MSILSGLADQLNALGYQAKFIVNAILGEYRLGRNPGDFSDTVQLVGKKQTKVWQLPVLWSFDPRTGQTYQGVDPKAEGKPYEYGYIKCLSNWHDLITVFAVAAHNNPRLMAQVCGDVLRPLSPWYYAHRNSYSDLPRTFDTQFGIEPVTAGLLASIALLLGKAIAAYFEAQNVVDTQEPSADPSAPFDLTSLDVSPSPAATLPDPTPHAALPVPVPPGGNSVSPLLIVAVAFLLLNH